VRFGEIGGHGSSIVRSFDAGYPRRGDVRSPGGAPQGRDEVPLPV
jgi:hypothetical protein